MKNLNIIKRLIIFLLIIALICGVLFLQACAEKENESKNSGVGQETIGETETEATTPDPTPEPTPAPTTTEKPPIITEEILKWTFTPEEKMFKTSSQTKNLRVEDGILKMESTGGDPFVMSVNANIGIDASEIDYIKFKIKNNSDGYRCQLFFITNKDTAWSEPQSIKNEYWFSDGEDWEILEFDTSDCDVWEGTIKQLRFDYLEQEGDVEIEYMTFEKIVK
ncbi:MAG: hypothetical protein FWF92_04740 [Oscillospiraceae bacterium]|nr:hypothetical protein [Oscillospiraceae bacterium]